jgi:tRNA A37 threonylcarbamoyladenosine biosynthesis protein TsaE
VHLDLYRLAGDEELENLGLRDWLAEQNCWIVLEWPERAPRLLAHCDIILDFAERVPTGRTVTASSSTGAGNEALTRLRQAASSKKF